MFAQLGRKHTFHGSLHVVEHIVYNLIEAYLDALVFGYLLGVAVGADVEADDDRVRGRGEHNVGFRNASDAFVDYVYRDCVGAHLHERRMEGFERALHVSLEDYAELRDFFSLHLLVELFERQALRLALVGLAAFEFALRHKLARLALRRKRRELLAGLRDALKAEDLDRHTRAGFVHVASLVVYHRADFAPRGAGVYDVAAAQRTVLHDDGGDGALALVEVRLDDGAGGRGLRVRLQLLHFGDEQKHFEKVVHVEPLLSRYVDHNRVSAPFLGDEAVVGELLAHALWLRLGLVYLVDRDDYRNAGGLRVVESLDGLRLDAVIRSDDEYGDVGNLSAARAHRGEGLVSRRVEEDERVAVVFDARGSDVLRDAAGLFFGNVRLSNVVEKRRLAVVDVAHDGDDRRARLKFSVAALFALFLFILGFEFFV